jgi:hypothetical protein
LRTGAPVRHVACDICRTGVARPAGGGQRSRHRDLTRSAAEGELSGSTASPMRSIFGRLHGAWAVGQKKAESSRGQIPPSTVMCMSGTLPVMARISTICVALAVLALSANGASAKAFGTPQHIASHAHPTPRKHGFEVKDFSFGVENPTDIGRGTHGAGSGKIKFNEFNISRTIPTACRHCPHLAVSPTK